MGLYSQRFENVKDHGYGHDEAPINITSADQDAGVPLSLFSLEAFSPREVACCPEAGVPVLLVRGHGTNQLRLTPVDRREKRLEHRHVVTPDRLVNTAAEIARGSTIGRIEIPGDQEFPKARRAF